MFERFKPVTICDQFVFLLLRKLKSKSFWKTFYVSFNCLIKNFGFNAIEHSQITVKHNLSLPDYFNQRFNSDGFDVTICDRKLMSFLLRRSVCRLCLV